ncbi:unnamed protein product [Leptidea sinapis]|uniref:Anaphase-promoting complex subunit 4 WD40 domain-containing protein n=1 Tax=Leptidea sinapis TaxID=189913 RepID=A0A5E4QFE2_9NEOP|nr:unnamed protein product [Leptidea sinapis]
MASSLFNISTYSRFNLSESESDITVFVKEYGYRIKRQLEREQEDEGIPFPSFAERRLKAQDQSWINENYDIFFKDTPNDYLTKISYLSECGFITSMIYSPDGIFLIAGFSTGLIQMRHGSTGVVLSTLRHIQFPPKPVYALQYSRLEERVCYAACADGAVYKIDIPNIVVSVDDPPEYCIRADPALESMTTQFFGNPGILTFAVPFITQRTPALSLGTTADQAKLVVGYADTSIKVYDMETQEAETTYKVQKLRLQLIPKKLQRLHFGQRDSLIVGSWQPTEALSVWNLVAKKRECIVRVQNRRPNVDGEYIHACQFWRSKEFNRKGKYGIIGGSGTNCVEVINLHNRYIACSYPAPGTITAITSFNERIAFSGTAPVLTIVTFHDPKHEKYGPDPEPEFDYTKEPRWFPDDVTDSSDVTQHIDMDEVHAASAISRPGISSISRPGISSISRPGMSSTTPAVRSATSREQ